MDKIDGAMIFMACVLFLALVVVSDYESFEQSCGAPKTPMDNLTTFLDYDLTSDGVYDFDDYHCVHFSIALAENGYRLSAFQQLGAWKYGRGVLRSVGTDTPKV